MIHTRTRAVGLTIGAALFACAFGAQAQLSYQSSSSVVGTLELYVRGDMGDYAMYSYNVPGDNVAGNALASASFNLPANTTDPETDLGPITSNGQFGFSLNGQTKVTGTKMQGSLISQILDANGNPTSAQQDTTFRSWTYSRFTDQWLINADANHAAGTYGAVILGIHLDAKPASGAPSGTINTYYGGQLFAKSSFADPALDPTSDHSDYVGITGSSTEASWTGSGTAYKKILFKYGTPFSLTMQLNGIGFENTALELSGRIDSVELPYGTTLLTGAQQSGLAGVDYGTVFNAASLNDQNTNWDFANNGGGFTPAVPEPATYALLIGGLAVVGARKRWHRAL